MGEWLVMGKNSLSVEKIKNRCEQVGLVYVSHYIDKEKKCTFVIAKCQCGEVIKTRLSNITKYIRENKIYSCKECGYKKTSEAQKGEKNHMYGKKGELHHSYGIPMSQEQKNKISDTVKGKYENGYINPNYGKKPSEETRQKMRDNHADFSGDKNPMYGVHLYGELNYNWKNGITPISVYLRGYTNSWVKQCLQKTNGLCELTKKTCCDVHHLFSFNQIVVLAHEINNIQIKPQIKNYTEEELQLLKNYIAEWHKDTTNGVVLCEEVHKLFHQNYGYGNNTPEQFEEFKQRYLNGEFDTEEIDSVTDVA